MIRYEFEHVLRMNRRHWPLLIAGLGLVVATASGVARIPSTPEALPGKLVATQERLTWTGPNDESSRLLSIDAAGAKFEIENVGGTPVRILEVESTCGCATPKLSTKIITPGGVGFVEVKATPIRVGEKVAGITLRTDSPISPALTLLLIVKGSSRPPSMV